MVPSVEPGGFVVEGWALVVSDVLTPAPEAEVEAASALVVSAGRDDLAAVVVGSSCPPPTLDPKASPLSFRRPAILRKNS